LPARRAQAGASACLRAMMHRQAQAGKGEDFSHIP